MEYLMEVFGDMPVNKVIILIAALLFLIGCYRKISKYFGQKAIEDYKQSCQLQNVMDQAKDYPEWHKHSLKVQEQFTNMMAAIDRKVDDLARASGEGMAYTWRYRILRFDDEIRHDKRHTKEHFDQVLEDIDNYEIYCRNHPSFPNNKAVLAIKNIKDVYDKCTDENLFL